MNYIKEQEQESQKRKKKKDYIKATNIFNSRTNHPQDYQVLPQHKNFLKLTGRWIKGKKFLDIKNKAIQTKHK